MLIIRQEGKTIKTDTYIIQCVSVCVCVYIGHTCTLHVLRTSSASWSIMVGDTGTMPGSCSLMSVIFSCSSTPWLCRDLLRLSVIPDNERTT